MPAEHVPPPQQARPHALQFFESVARFVHVPLQLVKPASHAKPHEPLEQVGVAFATDGHVASASHWPFAPHVSVCVAVAHCTEPGTHTPVQLPAEQTYGQAVPATHAPLALQV
jgi:hypothetical protein